MKKKLMAILLSFIFILSLFPTQAFAFLIPPLTDAPSTNIEVNAYKIWSVCRAAGLSEWQAAALLGNMTAESGLDPAKVESDHVGLGVKYNRDYNARDPEGYWQNVMKPSYQKSGISLDEKGYLCSDGKHHAAFGIVQFTGGEQDEINKWAEEHKYDKFLMETQLAYLFDPKSPYAKRLDSYVETSNKSTNIDDVTWTCFKKFIVSRVNSRSHKIYVSRAVFAAGWHEKFKGSSGDRIYGKKVLEMANRKGTYNGVNGTFTIQDRGILHDLVAPAIIYPMNSGFGVFDINKKAYNNATEAATYLLYNMNNKDGKKYSLYELFGSDIHFYRYLGEATHPVELFDHMWSAISQNKINLLEIQKDVLNYSSKTYLSCNVYKGRPDVLTKKLVEQGMVDPRVNYFGGALFFGAEYITAEILLTMSKMIVSLVSFLMSDKLLIALNESFVYVLTNPMWKKITDPLFTLLLVFGMIAFLFSIVKLVFGFVAGRDSFKHIFKRLLFGIIAIFMLGSLIADPIKANKVILNTATMITNTFNSSLAQTYEKDDILGVQDKDLATEAALWKKTVFEPWVKGQFGGRDYEHVYSQYATDKKDDEKLPQDNMSADEIKNLPEGTPGFNSAKLTGDIQVPVGNGKMLRNWAAYLYSCGSIWHIDQMSIDKNASNKDKELLSKQDKSNMSFPYALTTAHNPNLYADLFRVVDAQMNISPQYFKDGTTLSSYINSHEIQTEYLPRALEASFYTIILCIFFLPLACMKLYYFAMMTLLLLQAIYYMLSELFREGSGFDGLMSKLLEYLKKYVLVCFRLFILTILYVQLIGKGFIPLVMFFILSIVLLNFTSFNKIGVIASQVKKKSTVAFNDFKTKTKLGRRLSE